MRLSVFVAAVGAASFVAAIPKYKNGFPAPNGKALAKIQKVAGGSLPDGALPKKLSKTAIATFQVVAHQEIFEVAYFSSLLQNITKGVPGYKTADKAFLQKSLLRIRAQEELHALGANGLLQTVGAPTVKGCEYIFPVSDLDSAIALANLYTDVVLGVVPTVQALVAADGGQEEGLIPLLGSILAQEGEQVGYFRAYQGKPPSAAPFLTGGAGQFAYSALRLFLKPNSCNIYPDVPFFPPITVLTPPNAGSTSITMEVEGEVTSAMKVAYISGQHSPFVRPITNIKKKGKFTTFKAAFPFASGFSKGLTIAAVTKSGKGLTSPAAVAADAVYGPGLIEIG